MQTAALWDYLEVFDNGPPAALEPLQQPTAAPAKRDSKVRRENIASNTTTSVGTKLTKP